jgi:hypothetical protein
MISLCSSIGSNNRNVKFKEIEALLYDLSARVTQTKLLDGSESLVHSGTVDGDRTITFTARYTDALAYDLKLIHENDTRVILSCKEGVFNGAIQRVTITGSRINVTYLVETKETT